MRHVVGLAEMRVSASPGDELVAYALGSCLGVAIHDPQAAVGGLLHAVLPLSSANPDGAQRNACRFVDTGVPELFRACYRLGAAKHRLTVAVAGGASMAEPDGEDLFAIGRRNMVVLRRLLWKNGLLLRASDVGGHESRTLSLTIGSGTVTVRARGRVSRL